MTDLINTLETPGEFDALASLRPGEPYFLLVGRDRTAPGLVLEWGDKNRRRAMAKADAGRLDQGGLERELRKSTQAEVIAWGMQAYKRGEDSEPRVSEAPRPTYSGARLDPETHARDMEHRARAKAANVINSAIAELTTANEELALYGVEAASKTLLDILRATVDSIAPARPI